MRTQSLPLHEVGAEVAGDGVAEAGEEVSYHIISHKYEVKIRAQREIHCSK